MQRKASRTRLAGVLLGLAAGLALGFAAVHEAAAQDRNAEGQAKAPAGEPGLIPAQVTVVSVSGVAHKRTMDDPRSRWELVRRGDVLSELTIIRTGLGTRVVLQLADRGRVTLRSGTKVGIGTFRRQGKVLKARLGLKYGSMRARVDGAHGPNDLQVSTPVAAMSVRGCGADVSQTERLNFYVFEHQWRFTTPDGKDKLVRQDEGTDQNGTPWRSLLIALGFVNIGGEPGPHSLQENPDGRAILDFSAGDGGRWLFATPPGSGQGGSGQGFGNFPAGQGSSDRRNGGIPMNPPPGQQD